MTFLEIQDRVLSRLNLTSDDARNRVKDEINDRLRWVQTDCGLGQTRFGTVSGVTTSGEPLLTISGVSHIQTVFDKDYYRKPLTEVTLESIRIRDAGEMVNAYPYSYAIEEQLADSIVLHLFPIPVASGTLYVDALVAGTELTASGDTPTFPEDFHDILVYGAMADEYYKMEKTRPLAETFDAKFETRLNQLKYFLAKSAWLTRQQTAKSGAVDLASVWPYANLAV